VDAVPADADGELVCAQLAGVEEAEQLDAAEVGLEQLPVLALVVLPQVPGVVGLFGVRRGEGEPVRRGDVGDRRDGGDPLQQAVGLVDMLDRLQEDDGIDLPVEVLNQPPLEGQVLPPVAGARVLVGLRVGVDADHLGGPPGQQVGAVALAAGEVDDPQPLAARGDPLVDGHVPPVPVVLLGNVRQRPLAGQFEGRDALRLVLLKVGLLGLGHMGKLEPPLGGCPAPKIRRRACVDEPGQDQGGQRALPRRGGGVLRLQVGDRLRGDRSGAGDRQAPQGARPPRG
jgi:hypothetical protein